MNTSKNIIISYFYIKKTSAIYVACVSGIERGGEGGGEKEWEFGKGRKRTTAVSKLWIYENSLLNEKNLNINFDEDPLSAFND